MIDLQQLMWNIRVLKAYINKKSPDNLSLILGTYGRPSNVGKISRLTSLENSCYPIEKLELIPKIKNINSEKTKNLLTF